MQIFFNNKRKMSQVKEQGKIILILFSVFCGFFFKAQAEVSTEKAKAVEAEFKNGRFQMEFLEVPLFMHGPCYQEAIFYLTRENGQTVRKIANHLINGLQPNGVEILLYPHDGKILFFGSFIGNPYKEPTHADIKEVVEQFMGEDIETKLNQSEKRKMKLVEDGKIAFLDMSTKTSANSQRDALNALTSQFQRHPVPIHTQEPKTEELVDYITEYRITQSLEDPNRAFLKRISGNETSYCELEIKKFE